LYRLLAGRPPYGEGKPLETILKVLSVKPPSPIRDHRPDVPAGLEQICLKCLKKDPAERYQTARELAQELRRFKAKTTQPQVMTTARVSLPQVFLVMQSTGQQIRLMGPATVIGRDPDCTLQLEELTVAERHCQVLIDARTGEVAVEDLGS